MCCVVVAAAGCLYYPNLGSLSDGAPTGADASSLDVVAEARPPDGGDAGGFCQSANHAFCADFDQGPVLSGWDSPQLDFGGTITASSTRYVSPSTSAAILMPRRGAAAPTSYVTLNKGWPGWRHVIIDFEVYLEAPSWDTLDVNSGIFAVEFFSASNDQGISLSAGKDYLTVGNPGTAMGGKPVPNDRWFHVQFDVDPTKGLKATIDDQVFSATWSAQAGASPTMRIYLGVSGFNQPAPEYRLDYDNVTVDFP